MLHLSLSDTVVPDCSCLYADQSHSHGLNASSRNEDH